MSHQIVVYAQDTSNGNRVRLRALTFHSEQDALDIFTNISCDYDHFPLITGCYLIVELHTRGDQFSRNVSRFDSIFTESIGVTQDEINETLDTYKMLPLLDVA